MGIFGRKSTRTRLRKASELAPSTPPFRSDLDCTPWVLSGLWPADLEHLTPETESLADYLKKDLQRIADSANEKLRAIAAAGLPEPTRQSEEHRVLNVARAFAVLRVESTVRQLRREPLGFQPELLSVTAPRVQAEPRHEADPEPRPEPPPEPEPLPEPQVPEPEPEPVARHRKPVASAAFGWSYDDAEPKHSAEPEPVRVDPPAISAQAVEKPPAPPETDEQQLRRVVRYVARQVPGLRWAVGRRADGTTLLATDLAYGWIPAGVDIPAGVELLDPQRRSGNLAAMLGHPEQMVSYSPGDTFGPAGDGPLTPSDDARLLEPVEDLGWRLAEATHWRDGLPRMVHTLAKAGGAGTGVLDAEVDVLRVHLDTARYQLTARYPDLDNALLLNCLLLAATEAVATGATVAANYHFSWFLALSTPPASAWNSASG